MDEEFPFLTVKDPKVVIDKGRLKGQGPFALSGLTALLNTTPAAIPSAKPKRSSIKPSLIRQPSVWEQEDLQEVEQPPAKRARRGIRPKRTATLGIASSDAQEEEEEEEEDIQGKTQSSIYVAAEECP